jgi:23S rRNA (cytidine1920-2'-O)/16S rRNA (cytidine1409-2'-O)-methyltransferase
MTNSRLDNLLTEHHGYASRSRARDAILRGCVFVNGVAATRPGATISSDASIAIDDPAKSYVSRAALKLIHALDEVKIDVTGMTALDLGASTGGFTQVLLERGAAHVFAIDVGAGQIDPALAEDPRVTSIENLNVRDLAPDHLGGTKPHVIVSDLSFISLKLALPAALSLAAEEATGIFLIKPQFEVGRENIGKGGIVRDPLLAETSARDVANWLDMEMGWALEHFTRSPIAGGDGNTEYLAVCRKKQDA